MLKETLSMSERFGLQSQTPTDPDADLRAWLRTYAGKHPCHGFRRVWAALRHDEGQAINVKKVHRLWCEEGLQRRVHGPRKRSGTSSVPTVVADAPKVVWAIDFQFDSTTDGKAIKIASMVDEHTRESLLHLVERSITADRLVPELERVFVAAGGPPKVLRMDNGPELVSQALQQFCKGKVGLSYIPPGTPWNNGYIESFNNRLRKECLNRNHWNTLFEARVVIGDFKDEHNHPAPPLGPGLPNTGRVHLPMRPHPRPRGGLRDQLTPENNNPGSKRVDLLSGTRHRPCTPPRYVAQEFSATNWSTRGLSEPFPAISRRKSDYHLGRA
jgi:putative transposase